MLLIAGSEQRYAVAHVALHRSRVTFLVDDDVMRTDGQAVDADVEVPLTCERGNREKRSRQQHQGGQNAVPRAGARRNEDGLEGLAVHAGGIRCEREGFTHAI